MAQSSKLQQRKSNAATLSVVSNTLLVIGKLIVGIVTGSVSVISEAIHSGMDLAAALIAFFAVRKAAEPADQRHPFGHGKYENISGAIEALLIFAAAAWIISEAIHKLIAPADVEAAGWGVLVMLVSAVVNMGVSSHLFRVAREGDSVALEADAWHLRTDVYTSAGVMAGLGLMMLGDRLLPEYDWRWLDPVTAIGVALLICRAAWHLTVSAGRDLFDVSLPADECQWLREYLARPLPGVCGVHKVRTRKGGAMRFIEFHLLIDGRASVAGSHHLTDIMAADIQEYFPGASVTIHVEPCDGRCDETREDSWLIPVEQRLPLDGQDPSVNVARVSGDDRGRR